jgi:nicotinamidase-related amidase
MKRYSKLLDRNKSALLIIDVQERILGVMYNKDFFLENIIKLIKGIKVLNIPIFLTEQYPKGLGETISEIKSELENSAIQKMSFSCFGAESLFQELINKNITQVILCGIESHVCVQQTALDLIENGFQVNLAADAVTSRKISDYQIAIERMRSSGVEITSTESILFELLNVCGTEEFKSVSKIVK